MIDARVTAEVMVEVSLAHPYNADSAGVCVYYCRTYYKAVREGGGEGGGHVL
jgi:hypothetical protein